MSALLRPRTKICALAKIAKERLRKNNYSNETSPSGINSALCLANYVNRQKQTCAPCLKEEKRKTYDEELYQKVCHLIENNHLQNPVSALIDKQLFSSLDTEAKQYYINNLAQKFKFLKNRYYEEHSISLTM